MILQFNIIVAFAKEVTIPQSTRFGTLIVSGKDGLWDLTCKAGRQANQAFVVLFQQLLINAGLGVKALYESR